MLYWTDKGAYQPTWNELYDNLVPSVGKSATVGGEILRAASRIYYDAYNNGFLNNTSGALNYLDSQDIPDFYEITKPIAPCVNSAGYSDFDEGDAVDQALDNMIDAVVEYLTSNPSIIKQENDEDLFSYQDDDAVEEYDEDDEW